MGRQFLPDELWFKSAFCPFATWDSEGLSLSSGPLTPPQPLGLLRERERVPRLPPSGALLIRGSRCACARTPAQGAPLVWEAVEEGLEQGWPWRG